MEIQLEIEYLVKKFVNEKTQIRCCGSCMGGYSDEMTCFICCGYSIKNINEWLKEKPELKEEARRYAQDVIEVNTCLSGCSSAW